MGRKFSLILLVASRNISLNKQDLPQLQVLDLSHNKVNSLAALHFRIGNVAKISLAYNEIKSLNGMCLWRVETG